MNLTASPYASTRVVIRVVIRVVTREEDVDRRQSDVNKGRRWPSARSSPQSHEATAASTHDGRHEGRHDGG